ncbi:MAG TPA: P1 family peptidase [Thermoplasmata archaeon]|nr:P1 family peptidase [Thermoplasmata archaeon]
MAARRTNRTLTGVRGVAVGCAADETLDSGVTAFLFDRLAPTVVDVRGPASATFDTHSLGLEATFGRREALFLAGGSIYGLDAARGVRTRLLETGRASGAFGDSYPLGRVSGAALYDLPRTLGTIPDYLPLGYAAASNASDAPVPEGRVGAGRGARVAKYAGFANARAGGQGSAVARVDRDHALGVVVVFNSVGGVHDPVTDHWLAASSTRGSRSSPYSAIRFGRGGPARGTTLAVLVTDLELDRRRLFFLAEHVHDGIARVVVPAHTSGEGDCVFAVSTAPESTRAVRARGTEVSMDTLGFCAETLVRDAAVRLFRRPGAVRP